jgi:hypothetical protein
MLVIRSVTLTLYQASFQGTNHVEHSPEGSKREHNIRDVVEPSYGPLSPCPGGIAYLEMVVSDTASDFELSWTTEARNEDV